MFQIQGVIRPHAIIILPSSSGMELLLCYEDEGVYIDTYGRITRETVLVLQWGEMPASVGELQHSTHTHTHTHKHTHTHTHTQTTHTHTHTHTRTQTDTHTHTHICWFLWFTGTLHRRNGFYTIQTDVLFPYTYPTPKLSPHRRRCISTFPPKSAHCMIYKHFKLWGH